MTQDPSRRPPNRIQQLSQTQQRSESQQSSPARRASRSKRWLARLSDRRRFQGTRLLDGSRALVLGVLFLSACTPQSTVSPKHAAAVMADVPNVLAVDAKDSFWGEPAAPVTLVAFVDLQCPYCAATDETLRRLREHYGPKRLRLVVKHLPLPFHASALPAARMARAVYDLKGAPAMLAFISAAYREPSLDAEALQRLASVQGLDAASVTESQWQAVDSAVASDLAAASDAGVRAVPSFFINGAGLIGGAAISEFIQAIDHESAASAELLRQGLSPLAVYDQRVAVNYRAAEEDADDAAQAEPEATELAYRVPIAGSPAQGPDGAWVTLVEFVDFECRYCQRVHATLEQLMLEYPGRLRWVVKHNPLSFHPNSAPAAALASEVFRQRGSRAFFEAMRKLVDAPALGDAVFRSLAEEHQLDADALNRALALGANVPALVADLEQADELEVQGTPHFFINGRRFSGARPIEEFRLQIDAEMKRVEALLAEQPALKDVYQYLLSRAAPPPGLKEVKAPAVEADAAQFGPKTAPVVLQIFSDFACPYCGRLMSTLKQLHERYPTQVQFVWRHHPLAFHKRATPAARASLAVKQQLGDTGFWQYADRLFGLGGTGLAGTPGPVYARAQGLGDTALVELALELGVAKETLESALTDKRYDAVLQHDAELAAALGITGTPAVLVNNYLVVGAQPLQKFQRLVEKCLAP